MKIAIRQSQKINSRIHNSRIAIRQLIAQLGIKLLRFSFTNTDSDCIVNCFLENRY